MVPSSFLLFVDFGPGLELIPLRQFPQLGPDWAVRKNLNKIAALENGSL